MYEITDRDWEKSPASEISGYDASTNTITGYKYGESYSEPGTNPYLHALYVNRGVTNEMRAWQYNGGSENNHGGNKEWYIDREHIWPKSHGFEDDESKVDKATSGARGDPMHLWAGDSYVNSDLHNNYYYGDVDRTRTFTNGEDTYSYASGNLKGYSKTLGGDKYVFEPQDSDKGDIARAVFYMVARYNNIAGDDTIENDNPNLELINDLNEWKKEGYISTSTTTGKLGILQDLLEWNKDDKVDQYELHRNNLLYGNFTNNRNPFIDFPEWADMIWGADKNTKSANPSTDEIARAQDYVPKTSDDTGGGNWIPGVDNKFVIIGAVVGGVVILVVVVFVLAKGNKKQKKALKKTAKKVVKSSTKSKKK